MCSAGEYFIWAILGVNVALLLANIKQRDQLESAVRVAEACRTQARKLRDEWKVAKMLSDATKDREG